MHVTRTLQDRDLCAQWEEATLHQFGEYCLKDLHDTAALSLFHGMEINAKGNLTDKVQSKQNVQRRDIEHLAVRGRIINNLNVLLLLVSQWFERGY